MMNKLTWLASYPKSGNTWARAFLAAYHFELPGQAVLEHVKEMTPSESHFREFVAVAKMPREEFDEAEIDDEARPDERISSLFGHGTVTFNIPYLFRTPEGMNLWVKGPCNSPKDGVHALEGLVETDWTSASFTMNWKLTRPDNLVRFERGEPICMVLPYPRGLLESCVPKCVPLEENQELAEA